MGNHEFNAIAYHTEWPHGSGKYLRAHDDPDSPWSEKNTTQHRAFLEQSGQLEERRRSNLAREVFAVASSRASRHLEQAVADDAELRRLLAEVQARELDPLTAVREILEKVFRIHDGDGDRTRAS